MPAHDSALPLEAPSGRPFHVHFVCTGNICRSPMGAVILTQLLDEAGLADDVVVSSSGTGDWHIGERADPRTITTLREHGYDGSTHRARTFEPDDYDTIDLVLAADDGHVATVQGLVGEEPTGKIRLIRSFDPTLAAAPDDERQTADRWYGTEADFERCFTEAEAACQGVVEQLREVYA